MALISLILALLLEQLRPVHLKASVRAVAARYVDAVARNFNAGRRRQGVLGWTLAVLPWVLAADIGYLLLHEVHPVLALAWNVGVLYLTLGFRALAHGVTVLLEPLRAGDLDRARALLAQRHGESAGEYTQTEITKVAIERGLTAAHRDVFAIIAWFVLVPAVLGSLVGGALGVLLCGPGGAVLYRMAALVEERWSARPQEEFGEFAGFAAEVFRRLDWVPARLTAISFAIVGDFEDAVYCWRSQAAAWGDRALGVVLSSGAGAIGVRLGETLHAGGAVRFRPELGLGEEADVEHLQSALGLVWRTLVLWVLVIGLTTLAHWLG